MSAGDWIVSVLAAILIKLSASVDDVAWLLPFVAGPSRRRNLRNGAQYVLTMLSVASVASLIAVGGGEAISSAVGDSGSGEAAEWPSERILGAVSGAALSLYSVVLFRNWLGEQREAAEEAATERAASVLASIVAAERAAVAFLRAAVEGAPAAEAGMEPADAAERGAAATDEEAAEASAERAEAERAATVAARTVGGNDVISAVWGWLLSVLGESPSRCLELQPPPRPADRAALQHVTAAEPGEAGGRRQPAQATVMTPPPPLAGATTAAGLELRGSPPPVCALHVGAETTPTSTATASNVTSTESE
eukprot:219320-Prymnesium_polylepis.1